ncbi:nuclear transport factor 2 family protein [Kitasatospora purpeofusca]|uniref:nuclear transport factor 2 family protein n=1 Tax=Kitasatospora purpeofusca TaxID=67352 RepID=UPI0033D387BF
MTATDIARALDDLLFAPDPDLPLDEAVARHFAPDYRQRTNGVWSDRAGFVEHIAKLRSLVREGRVEVHDELRDGTRYADRHTVTVTKFDGHTSRIEVYLFAELAPDGRFARVEETTLLLSGAEDDRELGSIR